MLTFTDRTRSGALFRLDNSYEVSDTYSQFLPNRLGGNNDFKAGVQYIYSQIELPDESDMNGRFAFRTDAPFNAAVPATYPERLFIRVPSPSDILLPMNVFVAFAQNKYQRGNLTLNVGVRYDLENTPITPTLGYNPFFSNPDDYVIDKNNIAPRLGFTWRPGGSTTSVLRGGYGKFYDKVILITTAPYINQSIYSTSFLAAFPTSTADSGPAAGRLPTDPMLLKYGPDGPIVDRAAINAAYPAGSVGRNTGRVYIDNPDRKTPSLHQLTFGYESSSPRRWRRLSITSTAGTVISVEFDVNPATRIDTSRTGRLDYTDIYGLAGQMGLTPFVNPVVTRQNIGQSEFDGANSRSRRGSRTSGQRAFRTPSATPVETASRRNSSSTPTR